ncbi:hypothetical protein BJX63DRAFT_171775 [Aspergillus granulosus]|uniref:Uncharacterized protein n=1 Tax=Aspergillus granulosus TaxID=176169 RepID=A0ABR4GT13_9EURO
MGTCQKALVQSAPETKIVYQPSRSIDIDCLLSPPVQRFHCRKDGLPEVHPLHCKLATEQTSRLDSQHWHHPIAHISGIAGIPGQDERGRFSRGIITDIICTCRPYTMSWQASSSYDPPGIQRVTGSGLLGTLRIVAKRNKLIGIVVLWNSVGV